jgi:hypothetical protein
MARKCFRIIIAGGREIFFKVEEDVGLCNRLTEYRRIKFINGIYVSL